MERGCLSQQPKSKHGGVCDAEPHWPEKSGGRANFFGHSRDTKSDGSPGSGLAKGRRRKHSRAKEQRGRSPQEAAECRLVIGQKEEREAVPAGMSHREGSKLLIKKGGLMKRLFQNC